MKKMLIAACAIALAAVSQAATIKWNSGAVTDGTGAAVTAANKIVGYLYTITDVAYDAYAAMDAATLSQTVGQAYVDGTLGTSEASAKNTYSSRGGAALSLPGTTAYSAGSTGYGLILYVDEANEMYMANVAAVPVPSSQNVTLDNLMNVLGGGTSGTATSWQAVPEPTSGLLLLLGMAGLALKRKQA